MVFKMLVSHKNVLFYMSLEIQSTYFKFFLFYNSSIWILLRLKTGHFQWQWANKREPKSIGTDSVLVCGKAKSLSPEFLYLCVTLY